MQKNRLNPYLVFALTIITCSCGVVLKTEKPEINTAKHELPSTESYMNIPILLDLYHLSSEANSQIPVQLYKENDIEVNDNIKVDLEISRRKQLSISTINGKLNTSIPIHVQGNASLSAKPCGICPTIESNQPFSADLTVLTSTKIGVDNQWNIKIQTSTDFILDKAPCINILGFDVCFSSVTRDQLKKQIPLINKQIDEEINKAYDLKEDAEKYWGQLNQPIQVMDSPVHLWAVLQPEGFNFAPPVSVNLNKMSLTLGLKTKVHTVIGEKPETKDPGTLPPVENVQAKNDLFEINIPVAIQLTEIIKATREELVGKTFPIPGSKRVVTINDLDMFGSNKTLIIKANIQSKGTKGDVYIYADPVYDTSTRSLKVENLRFDAKTNNVLANKAAWLANSFFIKVIQSRITYDLGKNVDEMKAQLEQSMKSLPYNNNLDLNLNIRDFKIKDVFFDPGYAYLSVNVSGKVSVNVK